MANLTDDDDDRYVAITNHRHNWKNRCHSTIYIQLPQLVVISHSNHAVQIIARVNLHPCGGIDME